MPVESENRTVIGIAAPLKIAALLSEAAAGKGLNVPSVTMPLAWLARKPGCTPNALLRASTTCTSSGWSSARAAPGITTASMNSAVARDRGFIDGSLRWGGVGRSILLPLPPVKPALREYPTRNNCFTCRTVDTHPVMAWLVSRGSGHAIHVLLLTARTDVDADLRRHDGGTDRHFTSRFGC
jgi:hypothetical protein